MKQSIKNILYFTVIVIIGSTGVGADSGTINQLPPKIKKIMIDPGFGGEESGPSSSCPDSNKSKDINLSISLKLAKMIRERLAVDVALTRDADKTMSLEDRATIVNNSKCDLFISIHCNAHEDNQVYGIETYYLNITPVETAAIKVSSENTKSDLNTPGLKAILQDLTRDSKTGKSRQLASAVQNSLCQYLGGRYDMVKNRGVKSAPFYVLIGTQMPSILIETSYISNPGECRRLNSEEYQKDLCEGIVQGLEKYTNNLNAKEQLSMVLSDRIGNSNTGLFTKTGRRK